MQASKRLLLFESAVHPTFSSEALAIFASMTTPPTTARKIIINNFVVSLKSSGVWAGLDVLYLLAAADSQAAIINWKNPGTFNAIAVSSPAFVADRGFTGDGATSRLRTQYAPSTNGINFTLNDASYWLFSLTSAAIGASDIGNTTNPRASMSVRNADNITARLNDAAADSRANLDGKGWYGAQRRGFADKRLWKDGTQQGAAFTTNSTGLPTQEQWICGSNSGIFSSRQIAAAAWGSSLTGLEPSFYTSMLAYMQAVGAA